MKFLNNMIDNFIVLLIILFFIGFVIYTFFDKNKGNGGSLSLS